MADINNIATVKAGLTLKSKFVFNISSVIVKILFSCCIKKKKMEKIQLYTDIKTQLMVDQNYCFNITPMCRLVIKLKKRLRLKDILFYQAKFEL